MREHRFEIGVSRVLSPPAVRHLVESPRDSILAHCFSDQIRPVYVHDRIPFQDI